ncbi:hypothetical protein ACMHYB_22700 [Sorangium sp. So ce1128]
MAASGGLLRILREGRQRKFLEAVEQITFSGGFAAQKGQEVLYVTERCVLRLTRDGLELSEVAPGIDIGDDILAHMAFKPLLPPGGPTLMDERIFRPELINLRTEFLHLSLEERIHFDAKTETLFLNFAGMQVRNRRDIEVVRQAVVRRCKASKNPPAKPGAFGAGAAQSGRIVGRSRAACGAT